MIIELPYPPPVLSPNARKHFMAKARAFKKYKNDCLIHLMVYRRLVGDALDGVKHFSLKFCPPDRHRRDIDNAVASSKALIDALANITGVDDSKFTLVFSWGEPRKGGAVLVEVLQQAEAA